MTRNLYVLFMTSPNLIAAAQQDRRRRQLLFMTIVVLVSLSAIPAAVFVPRWSPQGVLITFAALSSIVFGSLYAERADAWQRSRALMAFAVGGLAAVLVNITQLAFVALDRHHRTNPQYVLKAFGGAWIVTDMVIRQLPNMRHREETDR